MNIDSKVTLRELYSLFASTVGRSTIYVVTDYTHFKIRTRDTGEKISLDKANIAFTIYGNEDADRYIDPRYPESKVICFCAFDEDKIIAAIIAKE